MLLQLIGFLLLCLAQCSQVNRTFSIDYPNKTFLKDGQPYRYIAGEVHYFRIHPDLWNDRLQRIRALGFNVIQTYVAWNVHEKYEGKFDFSGGANLTRFLELAQQNDLLVLLRIGPYICAEWEYGGLPYWLLNKKGINLRHYNKPFLNAVTKYYNVLGPIVAPYIYKNGGPIILIQIENEYGSYAPAGDPKYLGYLRNLMHQLFGSDVPLITTDGGGNFLVKHGHVKGVLATVDFGPRFNINRAFAAARKYNPGGPVVNSEFYPGWFTLWGREYPGRWPKEQIINVMKKMYSRNASFSFYMIHGGTNFGFYNGAGRNGPVITSYDYNAPISESGDYGEMYLAIRDFVGGLKGFPTKPLPLPPKPKVRAYGNVSVSQTHDLITAFNLLAVNCHVHDKPWTFEKLDNPYGFAIYHTFVPTNVSGILYSSSIYDYGYVFNGYNESVGVLLNRVNKIKQHSLKYTANDSTAAQLTFIVENAGRLTYETKRLHKGIIGNVTFNGKVLSNWTSCGINFDAITTLNSGSLSKLKNPFPQTNQTGVFEGTFDISGEVTDTWIALPGFQKGVVLVNGFNLGRYWKYGPQQHLYVPGPVLKQTGNKVTVVELLGHAGKNLRVEFLNKPK